jgi:hypothetical protein
MRSLKQSLAERIIGTVEEVWADRITVLLDPDAPQATALNTGVPSGFPRINGYVLIPNESGATVCVISSVRIERLPFPKRTGTQKDFGLVDLPFPSRLMTLTPLGTLKAHSSLDDLSFEVRRGVDVFPSVGDSVLLPSPQELRAIVEVESRGRNQRILIGHCPTAGRAEVYVDPDKLFGRHLAVLGNTGAGKSCTVAGLIRWSIEAAQAKREQLAKTDPEGSKRNPRANARFIVLDPNGEYAHAFKDLGVRLFRVEPKDDEKQLKVPAWLWNGEEWAAFTEASPGVQRPILFNALRRLRSALGPPDAFETKVRGMVKRYRNRLKLIIEDEEHLRLGKREGVANVLLNIKNDFEEVANDSECTNTNLRNALNNVSSKAQEVEEAARQKGRARDDGSYWHNDFPEWGDEGLNAVLKALEETGRETGLNEGGQEFEEFNEDTPRYFHIKELPEYVDAIAASHSGRDIGQFVDTLNLRIRSLSKRSRLVTILEQEEESSLSLEKWLTDYIGADQASNGEIAVIDLSLVPSEAIYVVVSVLGRMVFEAIQRYRRDERRELPTTLVLEEAHTFVHRDLTGEGAPSAGKVCVRVFERIAREGRKFGLGLVLASQRPSEISPTVLSQCNTFLLHRIVNDRDQELVKRLVPDGLGTLLRDLPSLPSRRAILLGWASPAPVLVEVRTLQEEHRPHSPDPAFWEVWTGAEARPINWVKIAVGWQGAGIKESDASGCAVENEKAKFDIKGTGGNRREPEEDMDEENDIPF